MAHPNFVPAGTYMPQRPLSALPPLIRPVQSAPVHSRELVSLSFVPHRAAISLDLARSLLLRPATFLVLFSLFVSRFQIPTVNYPEIRAPGCADNVLNTCSDNAPTRARGMLISPLGFKEKEA